MAIDVGHGALRLPFGESIADLRVTERRDHGGRGDPVDPRSGDERDQREHDRHEGEFELVRPHSISSYVSQSLFHWRSRL